MSRRISPRSFAGVLFSLVLLSSYLSADAQNFNRPVPTELLPYEFHRYDTTDLGSYYLCAPYDNNGGPTTMRALKIIDQDGYLAWWTASSRKYFDFKYFPEHESFAFTKRVSVGPLKKHYVMNMNFELIDSIHVPYGKSDIHEFLIRPNGNYCFYGTEDTIMDLSGYIINGSPGSANTTLSNMVVWEYDSNHNLVMRWSSIEHIPPDAWAEGFGLPTGAFSFDYLHGNSIEFDTDGHMILSMRHANAVYKVDYNTGEIIWQLGGEQNQFTFLNDIGFAGQHDARRLPNGNLSLFDNQHGTPIGSRVVEYKLDMSDTSAFLVKEYDYDDTLNSYSLGGYRQMPNGYEIVGWGNTRRPKPSMTLLDSNHNIAADFFFHDTIVTYRAFFEAFELNRPEITCTNNGSDITLSAPSGYNRYQWSTGEQNQSIIVADTGEYVVWVNEGIGMMGSEPYRIDDLSSHCSTTSIMDDPSLDPEVESLGYYDLLGRKLDKIPFGTICLEVFSNGQIAKRLRWE